MKFVMVITLGGLIFLLGFFIGKVDFNGGIKFRNSDQYIYGDTSGSKVGVDADILWEAWSKLDQYYLEDEKLDKQKMMYGAVEGIIGALDDPYTQFLTPQATQDYKESSGGKFEGIGAFLKFNGEYTVVDSPIDDFPAQKAGMMAGDVILFIDEKDVAGVGSFEVAELIKGERGTTVKLKIFRPKDNKEMEFSIVREVIDIENIKLVEIKENKALIKMYKFNESDTQEFTRQWNAIVDEVQSKGVDGVVIDLRNNPGGRVDLVKFITEEFLKKGDMIMMEEEKNGKRVEFRSTRDGRLKDIKVIVLVNQGSASASEIMSGALQESDRATIIGMETVGKGVEQTVLELSDGSTMHIVFRRWLTPSGKQVKPSDAIKPDIEVDLSTEDFEQGNDPQLKRAWEELGITN